ncbi:hypothetical protein [Nostoc sp.]|uniref:hypothetical protein n=1 Tax=Nostoc sp. TaxID=1180 RepID=UPI002FFA1DC8
MSDRLEFLEARFDRLTRSDAKNQDQQLVLLTKQEEITVWFAHTSKPQISARAILSDLFKFAVSKSPTS